MSVLDPRKAEKALIKKGFVKVDTHHHYFEFVHEGKVVVRTRMSHNNQEINNYLISAMSKQCQVNKEDFLNLINCPLSQEGYIKKLKERGAID